MKLIIKLLGFIFLFILIIIIIKNNQYFNIYYENFNNCSINNQYLNKNELSSILIKNEDKYYEEFSKLDYKVRNINNISEYYQKIKNSCIDINNNQRKILNKAIFNANQKIKKYNTIGFDGLKASKIPWIIGLVRGKEYEEGFPHTRLNIIILPVQLLNNSSLISILIHEKIHIYQKLYINDIAKYLVINNFTKFANKNKNIRANPDIDNYIYINKNNEQLKCEYNNNPVSINDVIYYPKNNNIYEHPFELMAYTIENNITSRYI